MSKKQKETEKLEVWGRKQIIREDLLIEPSVYLGNYGKEPPKKKRVKNKL